MARKRWVRALLLVALAALSVKTLQDVGGLRVISTLLPPVIFFAFSYGPRSLRLPDPLKLYLAWTCIGMPALSTIAAGRPTFYAAYLVCTVVWGLALVIVASRKLGMSMLDLGSAYADAMTVMCLVSVLSVQQQWFGGYTLRTFSDFPTFFGLQLSVGVPFLRGRRRNLKRLVCLVTLFFTFSRLSFLLAGAVMLFQLRQESRRLFWGAVVGGSIALTAVALWTQVGFQMYDKMANLVSLATGETAQTEINPSDLGRLAYATVTLDGLADLRSLLIGHGIKTNHLIVGSQLDTSEWGLDESMADATVHNVYLELLSDLGSIGVGAFVLAMAYAALRIVRRHGPADPRTLSLAVFLVSYLFEANYVSFFFQFFVCFYLWGATADAPERRRADPGSPPPRRLPPLLA